MTQNTITGVAHYTPRHCVKKLTKLLQRYVRHIITQLICRPFALWSQVFCGLNAPSIMNFPYKNELYSTCTLFTSSL